MGFWERAGKKKIEHSYCNFKKEHRIANSLCNDNKTQGNHIECISVIQLKKKICLLLNNGQSFFYPGGLTCFLVSNMFLCLLIFHITALIKQGAYQCLNDQGKENVLSKIKCQIIFEIFTVILFHLLIMIEMINEKHFFLGIIYFFKFSILS